MKRFFLFLAIILLVSSCESDKSTPIIGRWKLEKALKNEKETDYLDSVYFEFFSDDTMKTNILGDDDTASFSIEDNVLVQNTNPKLQYLITKLDSANLVLEMKVNNIPFVIFLVKNDSGK